jgi:hypothetical protein
MYYGVQLIDKHCYRLQPPDPIQLTKGLYN